MSLNDQGRIHLERSGPWIGVAGLFVLLWIAVASSQFAPWWGVVLFVLLLIPGAVMVARLSRTQPRRAAWVPLGNLAVWFLITVLGLSFWGWKADAGNSASATRVLAAQCATKYENLRQTMGENGNPGQPGRRLTELWDAADVRATELSKRAKATDCPGGLESLTDRVAGIEKLIYGQADFDMVHALDLAERDLVHAKATRDYDPLPEKLRRAFETLRVHAPKANSQLAAQLDAVDATDPTDKSASKKSLADLATAATSNREYRTCQQALEVIGDYELDEE
ncbi:MAG: hypothetical protein M3Q98_01180 [Actinomycetota bacterium]|nr:hypothetical protein [Actinomycetota bacterium]